MAGGNATTGFCCTLDCVTDYSALFSSLTIISLLLLNCRYAAWRAGDQKHVERLFPRQCDSPGAQTPHVIHSFRRPPVNQSSSLSFHFTLTCVSSLQPLALCLTLLFFHLKLKLTLLHKSFLHGVICVSEFLHSLAFWFSSDIRSNFMK